MRWGEGGGIGDFERKIYHAPRVGTGSIAWPRRRLVYADLPYIASNLRENNLRAYATVKIHISVMICFLNIDFQNLQEFDYLRLASVAHGKEACDS